MQQLNPDSNSSGGSLVHTVANTRRTPVWYNMAKKAYFCLSRVSHSNFNGQEMPLGPLPESTPTQVAAHIAFASWVRSVEDCDTKTIEQMGVLEWMACGKDGMKAEADEWSSDQQWLEARPPLLVR